MAKRNPHLCRSYCVTGPLQKRDRSDPSAGPVFWYFIGLSCFGLSFGQIASRTFQTAVPTVRSNLCHLCLLNRWPHTILPRSCTWVDLANRRFEGLWVHGKSHFSKRPKFRVFLVNFCDALRQLISETRSAIAAPSNVAFSLCMYRGSVLCIHPALKTVCFSVPSAANGDANGKDKKPGSVPGVDQGP